jgi:tryptophan 2,3-dioxygenase
MAADDAGQDGPRLEVEGRTFYEDYVHASVLHHLQRPMTKDPLEMTFLVVTQVMELWFGLLVHDLRVVQRALRDDDLPAGIATLQRCDLHLRALNASWLPLARFTPREFGAFRPEISDGSGFQSAEYRLLEFLLGDKSASMLVPHRGMPDQYAELEAALHAPSVWDDVTALLARRGADVPAAVLQRDPAEPYEPAAEVEAAWAAVYAAPPGELTALGEALTDVAEQFSRWRYDHLLATKRAMGGRTGTGGSAGVTWLDKRVRRDVFPELWTARGRV